MRINLVGSIFFDIVYPDKINIIGGLINIASYLDSIVQQHDIYSSVGDDFFGKVILKKYLVDVDGKTNKVFIDRDKSHRITEQSPNRILTTIQPADLTHISYLDSVNLSRKQMRQIRKSTWVSADLHGELPLWMLRYIDVLFCDNMPPIKNIPKHLTVICKNFPNKTRLHNQFTNINFDSAPFVANLNSIGGGDLFCILTMIQRIQQGYFKLDEISKQVTYLLKTRKYNADKLQWEW